MAKNKKRRKKPVPKQFTPQSPITSPKDAVPEKTASEKETQKGKWHSQVFSVIIALGIALLLRTFAIEAFKIPTSSMEPTLMGSKRFGDKILALKHVYRLGDPKRWEVVLFEHPSGKNYIKRLIGLPGEEIRLFDGDVYIDKEITRKTPEAQEAASGWLLREIKRSMILENLAFFRTILGERLFSSKARGWFE